jgi:hypothetical protein
MDIVILDFQHQAVRFIIQEDVGKLRLIYILQLGSLAKTHPNCLKPKTEPDICSTHLNPSYLGGKDKRILQARPAKER